MKNRRLALACRFSIIQVLWTAMSALMLVKGHYTWGWWVFALVPCEVVIVASATVCVAWLVWRGFTWLIGDMEDWT